eukprot:6492764-Amphidinium_carterae.2
MQRIPPPPHFVSPKECVSAKSMAQKYSFSEEIVVESRKRLAKLTARLSEARVILVALEKSYTQPQQRAAMSKAIAKVGEYAAEIGENVREHMFKNLIATAMKAVTSPK